jgi:type I restriction enzyme S subunit
MKINGLPWVVESSTDWAISRLKYVAEVSLSNVDKKSVEGQVDVLLCNYVDVYKNRKISREIEFMPATATDLQVATFSLRKGDLLITKDSEAWDDIGVPAYVEEDLPDVLCGYHLALIRHDPSLVDGRYLAWVIEAEGLKNQFFVAANGITRFGIGKDAINDFRIPVPPLKIQRNIASYLDRETSEIDQLIGAKVRLLSLIAEKRRALIWRIVLSGTNEEVNQRQTDVEWIGTIPAHWQVVRGKQILRERDERSESGEEELLTVSHITGVTSRQEKDVTMFEAVSKEGYKICRTGDFAVNTMWAFMGAMGTAPIDGIVSPSYGVYILSPNIDPNWFDLLVRLPNFCEEVRRNSKGVWSSRLRLYAEALFDIRFPLPPLDEQRAIVRKLRNELSNANELEATTNRSMGLLQERRSALIAAAVTGQLEV